MLELYEILASLHRTRVQTATKWLQAKGLLVPMAEPWLKPHSPEWFATLEMWDPIQAAMTRAAISVAGHAEICSVCGDEPAQDFRLEMFDRPSYGVDTLRLCDDCLEARKSTGDLFERIV
jgi:hypothetical protein